MKNKEGNSLKEAYCLLSRRDHSESELQNKLQSKGFSDEDIHETLQLLRQRGMINDDALAQRLLDRYKAEGQYGIRMMILKMKRRGLTETVIQSVFAEYDKDSEFQAASAWIAKKFKNPHLEDHARICRSLANKGYTNDTIRKILTNFFS